MNTIAGKRPMGLRFLQQALFLLPCLISDGLISVAQSREPGLAKLSAHTDRVYAVDYLSDGRLVSGGFDKSLVLSSAAGSVERALAGHERPVLTVAASRDGAWLASGGVKGELKLWNLAAQDEPPRNLSGHRESVYCAGFSPDGKLLASCGEDDTRIYLWDVTEARSTKQLNAEDPDNKNGRRSIHAIAFSPDGGQLASCGEDRTLRLWDLAAGKELRRFEAEEYFVFAEKDKKIERTAKKGASQLALYTVAFSPDGRLIAAGGLDKTIRLWDAASGELKQTLAGHHDFVYSLAFNQQGSRLVSCGHTGRLHVWQVSDGTQLHTARLPAFANTAALSPDGTTVAAACADHHVYLVPLPEVAQ